MTPELRVLDVRIPMRDGVLLAADVCLPTENRPGPVLLMRTPYGRAGGRTSDDLVGASRQGWAFVVQDVRGTGESEGDFSPYQQEIADGDDTLRWIAQQAWSDGRVAMVGGSYVGATQWLAAMSGNPALKAVAPMVTGSGFCEGWTYEGGAFAHGFVTPWARLFAVRDPHVAEALRTAGMDSDLDRLLEVAPTHHPLARSWSPYRSWLNRDDTAWDRIDIAAAYGDLDTPAFHVGGWFDGFIEGTLANYVGLRQSARTPNARALQHLVVGPWTHAQLGARVQGELDFGDQAAVPASALQAEALGWLRRVLDGRESATACRASVFMMGNNEWVELPSWPPRSRELRLRLAVGRGRNEGALTRHSVTVNDAQMLGYDCADPVPTWGGRSIDFGFPTSGPREQSRIEGRDDVLVFTSDPLTRAVTVMGSATVSLCLSSDATSVDLVTRLCDVHPDGRSFNVLDGIRRVTPTPGVAEVHHVPMGTTAITFQAGHRIRLQVCSSNFPRFELNCCTEGTRHILTGPKMLSALSLRTVPTATALASCPSRSRRPS